MMAGALVRAPDQVEDGNQADIADTNTEKLTAPQTTLEARGREFERLMFDIPHTLAAQVDPEYGGLVHFVAERALARADNGEALFFPSWSANSFNSPSPQRLVARKSILLFAWS
jgi:hypothetical protein